MLIEGMDDDARPVLENQNDIRRLRRVMCSVLPVVAEAAHFDLAGASSFRTILNNCEHEFSNLGVLEQTAADAA